MVENEWSVCMVTDFTLSDGPSSNVAIQDIKAIEKYASCYNLNEFVDLVSDSISRQNLNICCTRATL